jgi:drug/metabolite transporter (DMT)-like permease
MPRPSGAVALVPALFVVLWSTGFITARLIAPHADPLAFLALRYLCAFVVLAIIALIPRAPWPRGRAMADAAVAGLLLHGIYLGGLFWAIAHGLPAGVAGLLSGLQPLLTAAVAGPLLGEHVGARQWGGIAAGLAGAALVLAPRLTSTAGGIPPIAALVGLGAVFAITAGTIWQKKTGGTGDLRTATAVQYIGALVPTALVVILTGELRFEVTWESTLGLAWAVLGLSVGAILLLLGLIRRGALSRVTALLYLVPPVTALMAWAFFGETLTPVQLAGMALASAGVALATMGSKPVSATS